MKSNSTSLSIATKPEPGKACQDFCRVTFPNVDIAVVLLVQGREGKIRFEIVTVPSQTLRQRFSGRPMRSSDCQEWAELCPAIHSILSANSRLEKMVTKTFADGQAEPDW
jgi:hypothetical protein